MRSRARPGRGQCDTQKHVEYTVALENPRVFDAFQTERLGLEDGLRLGGIELLDGGGFEHGHAPAAIRRVNITHEITPVAVRSLSKSAAFNGSAVESVLGDRPQVLPILQIRRARDSRFATAVWRDAARATDPIGEIPGGLVSGIENARRPGPVTRLEAHGLADEVAGSQQCGCEFALHALLKGYVVNLSTLPAIKSLFLSPTQ